MVLFSHLLRDVNAQLLSWEQGTGMLTSPARWLLKTPNLILYIYISIFHPVLFFLLDLLIMENMVKIVLHQVIHIFYIIYI